MFFNSTQFLYNAVDKVLDLSVVRIKGDMKDRSKFPVTWYLTASDIDAKFSDLTIDF